MENMNNESLKGLEAQDFGDVDAKLKDLQDKAAAARRGIALAQQLNDQARVQDLQNKLVGFELTIADIEMAQQSSQSGPAFKAEDHFDAAAFDTATQGERIDRQAAAGN